MNADARNGDARHAVEIEIGARVARLLGDGRPAVDVEEPLARVGLASVELAELRQLLEDELGIHVSLNRLLSGWSIRDVARAALRPDAGGPHVHAGASPYERHVNPVMGGLLRRLNMDKEYVRGDGCWLYDAFGTAYLDVVAGVGSVPFGHGGHEVWQAVRASGDAGEPGFVQPSALGPAGELAERLVDIAPGAMTNVTFANSGAEAAEAAIKLVRAATGRRGILSTRNGFHGKTLGALSATGRPEYQTAFGAPAANFRYVPYGDLDALTVALDEAGAEIAALLIEPIQGEGGVVVPPDGYLAGARELCDRHGVRLVLDEIQTGLGRTGRLFACEHEGVEPDVMLLAKALGGGVMPIGALLYNARTYSEEFAERHSSTFAANTLACRAGIATLDRLARDGGELVEHVAASGAKLRHALESLYRLHPDLIEEVRGRGFMLGLKLTTDRSRFGDRSLAGIVAEQGHLAALISSWLLNVAHVRTAPTILASSVLRLQPPLVFTDEMGTQLVDGLDRAFSQLERRGTQALINHMLPARRRRARGPAEDGAGERRPNVATEDAPLRFAFLAHPLDYGSYRKYDPALAGFDDGELAEVFGRTQDLIGPFVADRAEVISGAGRRIRGEFVVIPRTAEELQAMDPAEAVDLVQRGVELARDGGAHVVGLGGFTSVVTGGGVDLRECGAALSTGNDFTAVAGYELALDAYERLGEPPAHGTAAVVGAAGSVGRALAALLAGELGRVILLGNPAHHDASMRVLELTCERVARHLLALEPGTASGPMAAFAREARIRDPNALAAALLDEGWLTIGTDAAELLPQADLVATTTSAAGRLDLAPFLRAGTLVCDISRPHDIEEAIAAARPDVLVLEGGEVAVPAASDLGWGFGLPAGTALACMCEPMLLALEGRDDPAIKLDSAPEFLTALRGWARAHGFRIAPPRSFGRAVAPEDWERLRAARAGARSETTSATPVATS